MMLACAAAPGNMQIVRACTHCIWPRCMTFATTGQMQAWHRLLYMHHPPRWHATSHGQSKATLAGKHTWVRVKAAARAVLFPPNDQGAACWHGLALGPHHRPHLHPRQQLCAVQQGQPICMPWNNLQLPCAASVYITVMVCCSTNIAEHSAHAVTLTCWRYNCCKVCCRSQRRGTSLSYPTWEQHRLCSRAAAPSNHTKQAHHHKDLPYAMMRDVAGNRRSKLEERGAPCARCRRERCGHRWTAR